MNENLENNDWVNEVPTLAAMSKRNPFSVPAGYFDNCEKPIFSHVFFDGLKQKISSNSFQVPVNYFEELKEMIKTRIAFEQSVQPVNKFAVPENYFETLQNRITSKIEGEQETKKEAKIIPLWRRGFIRYASAACFLLMASFSIYFYQNNQISNIPASRIQSADFANEQMLYDIDESTIIEHLEAQNASTTKTTSATDTEVENYILKNYSSSDLAQEL